MFSNGDSRPMRLLTRRTGSILKNAAASPHATHLTTSGKQNNRLKNPSSPFADNYALSAHNHTIGNFPGTQRPKNRLVPRKQPVNPLP